MRSRRTTGTAIGTALLLAAVAYGSAQAQTTVSTSFEDDPDGDFTIGTSPITATFEGGEAQTLGNPALYTDGFFAWHVSPGSTGIVTFETPASDVSFFFRNAAGAGPGEARVVDVDGTVLATTGGTQSFQSVSVSRAAGESLIGRVEIENSGASGDVVVDEFSFTAGESAPPPPPPTGGDPLDDPIPMAIPTGVEIQLTEIASGLVAPNWGTHAPGDMTRLFVVDQSGLLYAIDLATLQSSVFLDLSDRLVELGAFGPGTFDERGFLGLAFHPNYASNGLLYTYTSEPVALLPDFSTMPVGETANHQSVIVEWQVPAPADPNSVVDPASARELLRIDQPQFNHNAGAIEFDANGYLFIALGDGGGADDSDPMVGHGAEGNGQDPSNPLGAVLRIDPLGNDSANGQYGIPMSNPFIGQAGMVDEIFAYGFRNPFRIAYDGESGNLFVADVGQNDVEEINIVTAGNNYGWNLKEGSFFFDPNGNDAGFVTNEDPGVPPDLVDPIAEYDHDEGIAVVGGFVYRAGSIPELEGRYVFGDFADPGSGGGRLFYLDPNDAVTALDIRGQSDLGMSLLGFGRDLSGNVYVLANGTGTPFGDTGVVLRVDPGPGRLDFTADATGVDEGAGTVTVSVARSGGAAGPASVTVTTADGTATAGEDYTETSVELTWADGESGEKVAEIPILDDSADEADETFTASLGNASGADLGDVVDATVTVNDDDDPPAPLPGPDNDDDDDGLFGIGSTGWILLLMLLGALAPRAVLRRH